MLVLRLFALCVVLYIKDYNVPQGRRPEKEEGGRREKGVKIILLQKDTNKFPKMVSEMVDEH